MYTTDVLGSKLAGPGIRALRIAEAVSAVAEVVLASEVQADLERDDFKVVQADDQELLDLIEWADVLIMQSPLLTRYPQLQRSKTLIVADLYNPFLFEHLQRNDYLDSDEHTELITMYVNDMVRFADYMICASEKQRDLWLGQLASLGRLNTRTYRSDPSLRNLINLAPFGVDESAPVQQRHAIRGAMPGIGVDDTVLLWGGGLYDWFDPLTLIRAVGVLAERRPDLRLVFLATNHANPLVGKMRIADEARALAAELGLLDTSVFFNQTWVPHEDRADWFLDADIGVSTHLDHLETAFSFRTRLLDYLWAGWPIVATAGDAFDPVIRQQKLGAVVRAEDVDGLADSIDALLSDPDALALAAANSRALASELTWSKALASLVEYCRAPYAAADDPRGERSVVKHGDVTLLEDELRAMRSSSSWRVTAPLRAVAQTIRRFRRG